MPLGDGRVLDYLGVYGRVPVRGVRDEGPRGVRGFRGGGLPDPSELRVRGGNHPVNRSQRIASVAQALFRFMMPGLDFPDDPYELSRAWMAYDYARDVLSHEYRPDSWEVRLFGTPMLVSVLRALTFRFYDYWMRGGWSGEPFRRVWPLEPPPTLTPDDIRNVEHFTKRRVDSDAHRDAFDTLMISLFWPLADFEDEFPGIPSLSEYSKQVLLTNPSASDELDFLLRSPSAKVKHLEAVKKADRTLSAMNQWRQGWRAVGQGRPTTLAAHAIGVPAPPDESINRQYDLRRLANRDVKDWYMSDTGRDENENFFHRPLRPYPFLAEHMGMISPKYMGKYYSTLPRSVEENPAQP